MISVGKNALTTFDCSDKPGPMSGARKHFSIAAATLQHTWIERRTYGAWQCDFLVQMQDVDNTQEELELQCYGFFRGSIVGIQYYTGQVNQREVC